MKGETIGTILVSGSNSRGWLIQTTNQTTSVTTNDSTRVFHVTLLSWGTAVSTLLLCNGSSANAIALPEIIVGGTSNQTYIGSDGMQHRVAIDSDYGYFGHTFPLGCYYVCDANIIQAGIICKADQF